MKDILMRKVKFKEVKHIVSEGIWLTDFSKNKLLLGIISDLQKSHQVDIESSCIQFYPILPTVDLLYNRCIFSKTKILKLVHYY